MVIEFASWTFGLQLLVAGALLMRGLSHMRGRRIQTASADVLLLMSRRYLIR